MGSLISKQRSPIYLPGKNTYPFFSGTTETVSVTWEVEDEICGLTCSSFLVSTPTACAVFIIQTMLGLPTVGETWCWLVKLGTSKVGIVGWVWTWGWTTATARALFSCSSFWTCFLYFNSHSGISGSPFP